MGGYAWQIHGWLIAIGVTSTFLAVPIALNRAVIHWRSSDDTGFEDLSPLFRWVQWITFAVFMVGLGVSSMQPISVGGFKQNWIETPPTHDSRLSANHDFRTVWLTTRNLSFASCETPV